MQTTEQLPANISQLIEQYQLGQFRMLYHRRGHRFLRWFLPTWFILVIVVLDYDVYKLVLDAVAPLSLNPVVPFAGTSIPVLIAVAQLGFYIGLIVLAALGVNPFAGWKKRLYLMDNGCIYTNRKAIEVVCWDEVKALIWRKKRGISLIHLKNGSTFRRIEEMGKPQEISAIIAGAVTERLLPEALAHYQEKGSLRFGPIFVTREGIAREGAAPLNSSALWKPHLVISWADVKDICFRDGTLSIQTSKQWKTWDAGLLETENIPNPTVCVALIKTILEADKSHGRATKQRINDMKHPMLLESRSCF